MKPVTFEIYDEFGMFNPESAAESFSVSARFFGGKPKTPSSNMRDTEDRQFFRNQMYPMIDQAMQGGGLLPSELRAEQMGESRRGLDSSFGTAMSEFESGLNRNIDPEDDRVRKYASALMHQGHAANKDSLRRSFRQQDYDDRATGMAMASDALANEKRMGIFGMEAYNNAITRAAANQSQFGTFGTNVASGLGSGLTNMYFADQMTRKA